MKDYSIVRSGDLDEFVAFIDKNGGPSSEKFQNIARNFTYKPDFQVDQNLDPFSNVYMEQMLALYVELSGRDLKQDTGELMSINVPYHVAGQNPYASDDIAFISKHARAVLTSLMVANPPANSHILDLGCGWGLSTEMMNFAGARVTAVDINPQFVELVEKRARRHDRSVTTVQSNFDDLNLVEKFDVAFFYECLHHAVKPWETLANITRFMAPHGRIVLAGEPINDIWWQHWGLRLDALSVYCIRKFGWFESGWTADFLQKCFEINGWQLQYLQNVGLDDGAIGIAERQGVEYVRPILRPYGAEDHRNQMRETAQDLISSPSPGKTKRFQKMRNLKRRVLGRPLL